jgi:DNA polymerase-3 subunit beta
VSANGEVLLPVKRFKQILESAKDKRLTLTSTNNGIAVSGYYDGSEQWGLDTLPPDEFPIIDEFMESAYHEIPAKALQETIRRTIFSTDKENARYALGGVCFELETDGTLWAVATCGRRLAVQHAVGHCVGNHAVGSAILPVNALKLLTKVLMDKSIDGDTGIKMSVNGKVNDERHMTGSAQFQCNGVTIFTRLVEGRFPKWRSVIPKTEDRLHAQVQCETLLAAVNRMMTTDQEPGVMFSFRPGSVTVSNQVKETGQAKVAIPLSFNDTVDFIFDVSFVKDYRRALPKETGVDV